ncbi:hypothetical protein HMPREF0973_02364 [Prevotella veroralis F0319]|uniref:Uncharacterized protein n=1 Tax=Prevotella veroralis F0319 TaxID=649761 RepID=C9MRV1_9BACT|nr:hypothetical protein HMPREF0973_02364 [Prevotella veroralis F0319]
MQIAYKLFKESSQALSAKVGSFPKQIWSRCRKTLMFCIRIL